MKPTILPYILMFCVTLTACQRKKSDKEITENIKSVAATQVLEDLNTYSFQLNNLTHSKYTSKIFLEKGSTRSGVYFQVKHIDSLIYENRILPDEFYTIDILHGISLEPLNNENYLFFVTKERQQGNAFAGVCDLGLYLFDLGRKSLLKVAYKGVDVDDTGKVAGQITNPKDIPTDPVVAKFIFQQMLAIGDYACLSLDPFDKYVKEIYLPDDRNCETKYGRMYALDNCSIDPIQGTWFEISRNPDDSNDFYFPRPCYSRYKIDKNQVEYYGYAYGDYEVYGKVRSSRKKFNLNDGSVSYELEISSIQDSTYTYGFTFSFLNYGSLMEPKFHSLIKLVKSQREGAGYIIGESWKDSFPTRDDGNCPR